MTRCRFGVPVKRVSLSPATRFIQAVAAVFLLAGGWHFPARCEPVAATNTGRAAAAAEKSAPATPAAAGSFRTIKDMAGRTVVIPGTIKKVLSTSPPPTTFVYMLAPEKLGAWIGPSPQQTGAKFVPKEYRDKPSFRWGRQLTPYEAYIAALPDLVFCGFESGNDTSHVSVTQEKLGAIPVVCVVNTRNATGYAETLRFMGDVLGVPDRAEQLTGYYQGVLDEVRTKVAAVPGEKRVRVYYAEGNDGLSTDPAGSVHSQLIEVCGGVNVADCQITSGAGMTAVTMESVLLWKPGVIITSSPEFAAHVYGDDTWKMIPAVRNRHVHLTPSRPYNWFDRPPGVNRIAGIPWTAHLFYPELFPDDWFAKRIKEFYSLYYHYELGDGDLRSLLNQVPH